MRRSWRKASFAEHRSSSRLLQDSRSRLTYTSGPRFHSPDPLQRRLEAYVAHVLADGLRDHQLNGALLGVRRAELSHQHLKLQLEPDMANEVLRILLPRFTTRTAASEEWPVCEFAATNGAWTSMTRRLRPRSPSPGRMEGPFVPSARDNEVLLWKRVPGGSLRDEQQEAEDWTASRGIEDLRVRDLLFSRLLRCPELVNGTAAPHGFANCYTHHPGDLVIEWCCGESVEALCAHLLAHGFADDVPRADAIRLFSQHSAQFGRATVILNRHAHVCTVVTRKKSPVPSGRGTRHDPVRGGAVIPACTALAIVARYLRDLAVLRQLERLLRGCDETQRVEVCRILASSLRSGVQSENAAPPDQACHR